MRRSKNSEALLLVSFKNPAPDTDHRKSGDIDHLDFTYFLTLMCTEEAWSITTAYLADPRHPTSK
jgi:hypothetical protein